MNKCPKCGRYVDPKTKPDLMFCDGNCKEPKKETRPADIIKATDTTKWWSD